MGDRSRDRWLKFLPAAGLISCSPAQQAEKAAEANRLCGCYRFVRPPAEVPGQDQRTPHESTCNIKRRPNAPPEGASAHDPASCAIWRLAYRRAADSETTALLRPSLAHVP